MGIKEDREAQAAQFVSMRNLLEGLAEIETTTVVEVSGYLLNKLTVDNPPRFLRQDKESLTRFVANKDKLDQLLRYVAYWGRFPDWGEDNPTDQEFDSHGWFRSEMTEFLERITVQPPPCCSPLWKPEPKRPHWYNAYEARERITLGEAVCLLLNVDPEDTQPIEDDSFWAAKRRWNNALCDAVDSGRIQSGSWGSDRDEQSLKHSDIKAWARATKAPWPFLDDSPAPTPESPEGRALIADLKASKARINELEKALQERSSTNINGKPQPTRLMELVVQVQERYWGMNWDPDDSSTRNSQKVIVEWLRTTYELSNAAANAVEKVACPFDRDPSTKKR